MNLYGMIQERYGDPAAFMTLVRTSMKEKGLTQSDIATKSGFDPARVSEWLCGRVHPSLETMVVLDEVVFGRQAAWAEQYQDPDAFVRRLTAGMKAHGIRQAHLAKRAGYSPPHVSAWMCGRVRPSMLTMVTLDEAMELLIEGDG